MAAIARRVALIDPQAERLDEHLAEGCRSARMLHGYADGADAVAKVLTAGCEAVAATGKPIVVLLRHGRALALTGAVSATPAIMATWFLGSETGNAIADLVFGDHAPQGRLPVSFPRHRGRSRSTTTIAVPDGRSSPTTRPTPPHPRKPASRHLRKRA